MQISVTARLTTFALQTILSDDGSRYVDIIFLLNNQTRATLGLRYEKKMTEKMHEQKLKEKHL